MFVFIILMRRIITSEPTKQQTPPHPICIQRPPSFSTKYIFTTRHKKLKQQPTPFGFESTLKIRINHLFTRRANKQKQKKHFTDGKQAERTGGRRNRQTNRDKITNQYVRMYTSANIFTVYLNASCCKYTATTATRSTYKISNIFYCKRFVNTTITATK